MTVGELIELLGKYDQNALVGVSKNGRQDEVYGISDIKQIDTVNDYGERHLDVVTIRAKPIINYGMNLMEYMSMKYNQPNK